MTHGPKFIPEKRPQSADAFDEDGAHPEAVISTRTEAGQRAERRGETFHFSSPDEGGAEHHMHGIRS